MKTCCCKSWDLDQIPDLTGKVAVVTGANTGLGFRSCLEFARNHATVVLACRSLDKGRAAVERILAELPKAQLELIPLDLTDSESISRFAETFAAKYQRLDILMNNGGVVNLPELRHAANGLEMQMATNHVGHYLLTGKLMPQILASPEARVVTLSSGGYKFADLDLEDMAWKKRPYHRTRSYGASKLANVLFAHWLQDYFEKVGAKALSLLAHPGLTGTERQQSEGIGGVFSRLAASPVEKGVRPQLFAATSPDVKGRDFFGPKYGLMGSPALHSLDSDVLEPRRIESLMRYTEDLTGLYYPES